LLLLVVQIKVAPRVGAWIETYSFKVIYQDNVIVAPRVGAWIETNNYTYWKSGLCPSRPAWTRFISYFTLGLRLFSEEVAIC